MTVVRIEPPASLGGLGCTLRAPLAKSQALRGLVAAAMAGGGVLEGMGLPWPEDVAVLVEGLRSLGVGVDVVGERVHVIGGPRGAGPVTVHAGEGAAPARFLLAVGATTGRRVTVTGAGRLGQRPLGGLLRVLEALGARVVGGPGLPVVVEGPLRGGGVVGVETVSTSQDLSALLLLAPALEGGLQLATTGPGVSRPYVDLTRQVMARFGVVVGSDLLVPAGSSYRPATLRIEPDWSGATILLAAAAFLGVPVTVPSLDLSSDQPDRAFAGILRDLGMEVVASGDGVVASGTTGRGGTFDLRDTPDAACALAALGVLLPEPLRIEGAPHLRGKESDRIAGLVSLLRAVGADAWERADGLEVGPAIRRPDARPTRSPVRLDIRGDHRLAMTAALLGLWRPVEFPGASCVAKSFPGFFGQWPGTR